MGQTFEQRISEYEKNAAMLAQMLTERDRFRSVLNGAEGPVATLAKARLIELEKMIENVEDLLAREYESIRAIQAKEQELSNMIEEVYGNAVEIYVLIKNDYSHLLASFTEAVIDPMTDEDREDFYDRAAILEYKR